MMLDVLLNVTVRSSGARCAKATEVGVVCVLVELLPNAVCHITERSLLLLERPCKCPEGWFIFTEHMLAVSAMSWSRFLGVESRVGDVGGGRRISSPTQTPLPFH